MSSLNKVQLIGNLGRDPEIRRTQDGRAIANFSVATSERWTDKQTGEKREKTEWHNVVCYNESLAGIIEKYVTKGSKVYIEGKLQTRKWTDKNGVEKYTTEVIMQGFDGKLVMLGGKNEDGGERSSGGSRASEKKQDNSDIDDEIPF
jgi:single-strand DNA-binding protein